MGSVPLVRRLFILASTVSFLTGILTAIWVTPAVAQTVSAADDPNKATPEMENPMPIAAEKKLGDILRSLTQTSDSFDIHNPQKRVIPLEGIVPFYLYHLLKPESLARMVDGKDLAQLSEGMPLKEIGGNGSKYGSLLSSFSSLSGAGLFTSINPFAAQQGGGSETYGGPTPLLIQMKIRDGARIGLVVTTADQGITTQVPKDKFDIILHLHFADSSYSLDPKNSVSNPILGSGLPIADYNEWVVLNPKAIEWWTANVDHIKDEIEALRRGDHETAKKTNGEFQYTADEAHTAMTALTDPQMAERMENSLMEITKRADLVPEIARQVIKIKPSAAMCAGGAGAK